MKEKYISMFWGAALIILGGMFLLLGRTTFTITNPVVGIIIFGGLSLLFFLSYFLIGIRRWGWLFPACIFASLTLIVLMVYLNPQLNAPYMGAPVFLGIAAPFLVAYFQERKQRWWALIPAWVMFVLAMVTAVADTLPGEVIGALFLLAVALPFLIIYLGDRDRTRKWALIPFAAITAVALIPLLSMQFSGENMGIVIMFLMAAPFLVVYFWNPRNWWALIPAGIFATIGLTVLAALFSQGKGASLSNLSQNLTGGVLFLGWALTFLILWLRRGSVPTTWAIYPAVGLGILSAAVFIGGNQGLSYTLPIAIIAAGLLMLINSQKRKSV